MERRREPRIACYQRAWLTVLGTQPRSIPCYAVELSGHGLRIVLDEPLTVNAAISVETGDWMAFGEVCYSRHEYSHYVAGLELDQVMMGLRELDALRRNRLNEGTKPRSLSFVLDVTKQPVP